MSTRLSVKQIRSLIGTPYKQRLVMQGLGLRGVGTEVTVENTPSFRGMIKRIMHLVSVQEVDAVQEGANLRPRETDKARVSSDKATILGV